MIVGFLVGLFRMLVDTPTTLDPNFHYAEGSLFWIVNNINFQYFSILITLVSAVVMVGVSYATAAPNYDQLKGLTFATATAEDNADTRASWGWGEVAASALVLACILGAYLYFRADHRISGSRPARPGGSRGETGTANPGLSSGRAHALFGACRRVQTGRPSSN